MTEYNAGEDIVQQYKDADSEELRQLLVNWINTANQSERNCAFWRTRSGLLADYILSFKYGIEVGDMNEYEKDANRLDIYRELDEFND